MANNPTLDTASDYSSASSWPSLTFWHPLKTWWRWGYLERFFSDGNRKLVHLKVLETAQEIVEAGREAQKEFFNTLFAGLTQADLTMMEGFHLQMAENLRVAIKEKG